MKLIDFGTKNQKLTASYYNQNLFDEQIKKKAAKKVILEYSDDLELVAVITAAIAASMGSTSTDGLVVRSIRRKPGAKWKRA